MEIIDNLESISRPFHNAVITIGNFDGVHIGHQALFHEVVEKADAIGGTAIAMTFEPHPLRVLKKNGDPPLITLYEQKAELIASSGIDVLICIPFTSQFADISADTFVRDILVKKIGVTAIVTGKDYTFGKNREGNLQLLKHLGSELGLEVIVSDWIQTGTCPDRISSTRIRELVMGGEMETARKLLGRHYQVRGAVVTGRNRGGKLLGFPTANIHLQDEICPKSGVYAVTVDCLGKTFQGVANIGYSPTFCDNQFTVEVHILDFHNDIYGKRIRVNFVKRIRDEKKFSGIEALSRQIRTDIEDARNILSFRHVSDESC
ncbi:MAG: bifunctional riboflavin kinase/FAD synthetase [Desulfatirhabdiaceae bacterium]